MLAWLLLACGLCACAGRAPAPATPRPTARPAQAATPRQSATPTPTPPLRPSIGVQGTLPAALRSALSAAQLGPLTEPATADVRFGVVPEGQESSLWVYALVAPFPTLTDALTLAELQAVWRGSAPGPNGATLVLSPATEAAFSPVWGPANPRYVRLVADDRVKAEVSLKKNTWALLPFEALDPSWKVLQVDQLSPLQKGLDLSRYPLVARFGFSGSYASLYELRRQVRAAGGLPPTNRDPNRLTVLVMTGVTALTRGTAARMEQYGSAYPARDILPWLRDADLLHISHEVSFNPACPAPVLADPSLLFCSRPKNIELLETIHANIIELTGNHLNDFGRESLVYTLGLYRQRGWLAYGAGETLEKARQAVSVTHNGNRLAFIGCNPAGPEGDWATPSLAGTAPCDYRWLTGEVRRLREAGFLPVVTLQYFESYAAAPGAQQQRDFRQMIDAGAILVSGSQAHRPQALEFVGDQLIHYGLGNLFFDQMDGAAQGTRSELIDRHVIYAGRLISTELLTAVLEDYARPRPATPAERAAMLREVFAASGWGQ